MADKTQRDERQLPSVQGRKARVELWDILGMLGDAEDPISGNAMVVASSRLILQELMELDHYVKADGYGLAGLLAIRLIALESAVGLDKRVWDEYERVKAVLASRLPKIDPMEERVVYYALNEGNRLVKIGLTSVGSLDKRMRAIQVYCPEGNIKVLKTFPCEAFAVKTEQEHHKMWEKDIARGEWYKYTENMEKFLQAGG